MTELERIEEYRTRPEGQTFDRKSARISPKDLAKDVVAMANADGGEIVVGIEDDGEITGIEAFAKNANDLRRVHLDFCNPSVNARIEELEYSVGNHVLVFHIPMGETVHATQADEAYLRVGDKSRRLSFQERTQLVYGKGDTYFEDVPVFRSSMADIDKDALTDYLSVIGYGKSPEAFLRENGFVTVTAGREEMTGAAILLFGKRPDLYFPRAQVRFIRYDGTEALTGAQMNVVKDITFEGRIKEQIDKACAFVQTQIKEHTFLGEGAIFKTIPELPEFCWNEMIINAVAHRDYSIKGTDIQIKMFDDRFVVESPGFLPGTVRPNNIRTTHFSRNPKIARYLKAYDLIKEFGEGVDRMFREMEEAGLPDPKYVQQDFILVATLRKSAKETTKENHPGTTNKLPTNYQEKLSGTALKILEALITNPKLTAKQLADGLGMKVDNVRFHLRKLREANIVEHKGPDKGGYWEVQKL